VSVIHEESFGVLPWMVVLVFAIAMLVVYILAATI
jgi:hypothetical protein